MINIEKKIDGDICELLVAGEADASSSIHLDDALGKALNKHNRVLVNLFALEYISSAGLGVFISYLQQIENDNIQLILFGLSEKVLEVFQILGLDQLINIKEDKAEALAELKDA